MRYKRTGDWLERILTAAIVLALAAWLIRTALRWLMEVWWMLAIIGILVLVAVIVYRLWKHHDDSQM